MPDDLEDLDFDEMGDEQGESSESAGGSSGGLKGLMSGSLVRVLLYVAAAIVVIIIAVIAGSWAGGRSSDDVESKQAVDTRVDKPDPWNIFELDQFMTNTADKDQTHLVRLKMKLAYDGKNMQLQLELNNRRAQIRDIILLFFNEKKQEDMDSAQQKRRLKKGLINRINKVLKNGEIKTIYYEEFSVN